MATIKEGYNEHPTSIKVRATGRDGLAEVWTEMYDSDTHSLTAERLHYATITELIELRNEINQAIKDLAGL